MEVSVDIEKVENFVTDPKFTNFIMNNTTDFGVAAFILQSLLNTVDEAKKNNKET